MGINDSQFIVVMRIWMGTLRVRVARIVVVVHACVKRDAGLVLVIETKSVTDLLAYHMQHFSFIVVLIG